MELFDNKQNLNLVIFPKYYYYSKLEVLKQLTYSIQFETFHSNLFVDFISYIKPRTKLNINFKLTQLFNQLKTEFIDFLDEFDYLISFLEFFLKDKNIIFEKQFLNLIQTIKIGNKLYAILNIFNSLITKLTAESNRILSYNELYPNESILNDNFKNLTAENLNNLDYDYSNLNLNLNFVNNENIEYLYPYLTSNQELYTELNTTYNITENLFYSLVENRTTESIFDKLLDRIKSFPDINFDKYFQKYYQLIKIFEVYNQICQIEIVKYNLSLLNPVTNFKIFLDLDKVKEMWGVQIINLFEKYFFPNFIIKFFFKIQEYCLFTNDSNYINSNKISFLSFQNSNFDNIKNNFYSKIDEFIKLNSKSYLHIIFNSNKDLNLNLSILLEELHYNIYDSLNLYFQNIIFDEVNIEKLVFNNSNLEIKNKIDQLIKIKLPINLIQLIFIKNSNFEYVEDKANNFTYIYNKNNLENVVLTELTICPDFFEQIITNYDNNFFNLKFNSPTINITKSIFFTSFQNISNKIKNQIEFTSKSEVEILNILFQIIVYKYLTYIFLLFENQLPILKNVHTDIIKINYLENSTNLNNINVLNELNIITHIDKINNNELQILDSIFELYDYFKLNQFIYYSLINSKIITFVALIKNSSPDEKNLKTYIFNFLNLICNDLILEKCNSKFITDNINLVINFLKETKKFEEIDEYINQSYKLIIEKKQNFEKYFKQKDIIYQNDNYLKIDNIRKIFEFNNIDLVEKYNQITIPNLDSDIDLETFNNIKINNIEIYSELIFKNYDLIDNNIFTIYTNFINDLKIQNSKVNQINKELILMKDLFSNNSLNKNKYEIKILEIESRLKRNLETQKQLEKKLNFTLDTTFSSFKFMSIYFTELISYLQTIEIDPNYLTSLKTIQNYFNKALPISITNKYNFEYFQKFSITFQKKINIEIKTLAKNFLDFYTSQINSIPQINFNNISEKNSKNIYNNVLNFLFIEQIYNSIPNKSLFEDVKKLESYVENFVSKKLNNLVLEESIKNKIIEALLKENIIDEIEGFKNYLNQIFNFKFNDLKTKIEFLGESLLLIIKVLIKNSFYKKSEEILKEKDFVKLKNKIDSIITDLSELNNNAIFYKEISKNNKFPKNYITNINKFITEDSIINEDIKNVINTFLKIDNNPTNFNNDLNDVKNSRKNLQRLNLFLEKVVNENNFKQLYSKSSDPNIEIEIKNNLISLNNKIETNNNKVLTYFNSKFNMLPQTIQNNILSINLEIEKNNHLNISNSGILINEILFNFLVDLTNNFIFDEDSKTKFNYVLTREIDHLNQLEIDNNKNFNNQLEIYKNYYINEIKTIKNEVDKYKDFLKSCTKTNNLLISDVSKIKFEIEDYKNKLNLLVEKINNKQANLKEIVDNEIDINLKTDIENLVKEFKIEATNKIKIFQENLQLYEKAVDNIKIDTIENEMLVDEIDVTKNILEIKKFINQLDEYKYYTTQSIVFENQINQIELCSNHLEIQINLLSKKYSNKYLNQLQKYKLNIQEFKIKIETDYSLALTKINEIINSSISKEDYLDYIKKINTNITNFNLNDQKITRHLENLDSDIVEYDVNNNYLLDEQLDIIKNINFLNQKIILYERQENVNETINKFKEETNLNRINQLEEMISSYKKNIIKNLEYKKELEKINGIYRLEIEEFKLNNVETRNIIDKKNQIIFSLINFISQKINLLNSLPLENLNFSFINNEINSVDFDDKINILFSNFAKSNSIELPDIDFENKEIELTNEINLFLSKTFDLQNITIQEFKIFLQQLTNFLQQNQSAVLIPKLCNILNLINNKVFNLENKLELNSGNLNIIDNTIKNNQETIENLENYSQSLKQQLKILQDELVIKNLELSNIKNLASTNQNVTFDIQNFLTNFLNSNSNEILALQRSIENNTINNFSFTLKNDLVNNKKNILNNVKNIVETNKNSLDFMQELINIITINPKLENGVYLQLIKNLSELNHLLICPLSLDIMKDPYIASDGYSYEKEYIEKYIRTAPNLVSPATKQPITANLIKNYKLKSFIESLEKVKNLVSIPSFDELIIRYGSDILNGVDPNFEQRYKDFFDFKSRQFLTLTEALQNSKINFSSNEIEILRLAEYNFADKIYSKYKTTYVNFIEDDKFKIGDKNLKAASIQIRGFITDLNIFLDENNNLSVNFNNDSLNVQTKTNFIEDKYNINKNGFQISKFLQYRNLKAILNVSELLANYEKSKSNLLYFLTPYPFTAEPTLHNVMKNNNLYLNCIRFFLEFDFTYNISNLHNIDVNSLYVDSEQNNIFITEVLKIKDYSPLKFFKILLDIVKNFSFYESYYDNNQNYVNEKIDENFDSNETKFDNLKNIINKFPLLNNFGNDFILSFFPPNEDNLQKVDKSEIKNEIIFILDIFYNQLYKLKNHFINIKSKEEFIKTIKSFNFLSQIFTRNKKIVEENEKDFNVLNYEMSKYKEQNSIDLKIDNAENVKIQSLLKGFDEKLIDNTINLINDTLEKSEINLMYGFSTVIKNIDLVLKNVIDFDLDTLIKTITEFDINRAKNIPVTKIKTKTDLTSIEDIISNVKKTVIKIYEEKNTRNQLENDIKQQSKKDYLILSEKINKLEENNTALYDKLEKINKEALEILKFLDIIVTDENKLVEFFKDDKTIEEFKIEFLSTNNNEKLVRICYEKLKEKFNPEYYTNLNFQIALENQIQILNDKKQSNAKLDFNPIINKPIKKNKLIEFNTYIKVNTIEIIFEYNLNTTTDNTIIIDIYANDYQNESISYIIYKILIQEIFATNEYNYTYKYLVNNLNTEFLPINYNELLTKIDRQNNLYSQIILNSYLKKNLSTNVIYYFLKPLESSDLNLNNTTIKPFLQTIDQSTFNQTAINTSYKDKLQNIQLNSFFIAPTEKLEFKSNIQNFDHQKILNKPESFDLKINNSKASKIIVKELFEPETKIEKLKYDNSFNTMQNKIQKIISNNPIQLKLIEDVDLKNKSLFDNLKNLINYLNTYNYPNLKNLSEKVIKQEINLLLLEVEDFEKKFVINENIQNFFKEIKEALLIKEIFNIEIKKVEQPQNLINIPPILQKPIIKFNDIIISKPVEIEINKELKNPMIVNLNNNVFVEAVKQDINNNENLLDYQFMEIEPNLVIPKQKFVFNLNKPIINIFEEVLENEFKLNLEDSLIQENEEKLIDLSNQNIQDDLIIEEENKNMEIDEENKNNDEIVLNLNFNKNFNKEKQDLLKLKFSKKNAGQKKLNIYPLLKQMVDQTNTDKWIQTLSKIDSITNFNLFDIDSGSILSLRALKNGFDIQNLNNYNEFDCVDIKYNNIPYANLALIGSYNPILKPIYFVFPLLPIYYKDKFKIQKTLAFQELLKKYDNVNSLINRLKKSSFEILNLEKVDIVSTFKFKDLRQFKNDLYKLIPEKFVPNEKFDQFIDEIADELRRLQINEEEEVENLINMFNEIVKIDPSETKRAALQNLKKQILFINDFLLNNIKSEFVLKKKTALIPKRFNFKALDFKYNIYIFYFNQVETYYKKRNKLQNDFYFKIDYDTKLLQSINKNSIIKNNLIYDKLFDDRNIFALRQIEITNSYENSELYI